MILSEPYTVGPLRKALYVLNMNIHKRSVSDEAKNRHLRALNRACLDHLGLTDVALRSLAVEIGDWVDTPDFQRNPDANAETINAIDGIIYAWIERTCPT